MYLLKLFLPLALSIALFPAAASGAAKLPAGFTTYKEKVYFSAAPKEKSFAQMKKQGVGVVIDLREPKELKGFESQAAEKNGMRYFNSPVAKEGELSRDQLDAVEKIVNENKQEKFWVYCSSSNRAGSWLAVHLAESHGMPLEEALAEGKKHGMKPESGAKVRTLLAAKKSL